LRQHNIGFRDGPLRPVDVVAGQGAIGAEVTAMALSPSSATTMKPAPVASSGTLRTCDASTPSRARSASASRP